MKAMKVRKASKAVEATKAKGKAAKTVSNAWAKTSKKNKLPQMPQKSSVEKLHQIENGLKPALRNSWYVNTKGTSEIWFASTLLNERKALLSDKMILNIFRKDSVLA